MSVHAVQVCLNIVKNGNCSACFANQQLVK